MIKNIILSLVIIGILGFAGYRLLGSKGAKTTDTLATTTPVVTETQATRDMYVVDLTASSVGWKGSFVSGAKSHTGTITLKSGEGKFENGTITSGLFVFDMSSIKDNDGSAQLETHLKSDDFFNVEMYPESKFELASLAPTAAADTFTATGKLTIRDVTKEISFPVVIVVENQNSLKATGVISFNRADFNVKYGSSSFFTGLGDKVIADKIELSLNLITKPIEVTQPPSSVQ